MNRFKKAFFFCFRYSRWNWSRSRDRWCWGNVIPCQKHIFEATLEILIKGETWNEEEWLWDF